MKPLVGRALDMLTDWYPAHPGVSSFAVAQEELTELLAAEVAKHPDLIEVEEVIRAALVAADRAMTNEGRNFFTNAKRGEGPLPFSEAYDSVIPLGNNDRVRIGDMGLNEYYRANALRYKNVRAAQDQYNAFVDFWEPLLPHLEKGLTVRRIPQSGTP